MSVEQLVESISDVILFISCLYILLGSILITFKTRFVQLRLFPTLCRTLFASLKKSSGEAGHDTLLPHDALFMAMSTTLGLGTIVAPVIAIYLGGPGALLGFLLTAFFGSAATYTEVTLCIEHREQHATGGIMGGPMQYLKQLLSPGAAKWYAGCCLFLMMAWSGAQANQLAAVLDSPFLEGYRIPVFVSGVAIALFVLVTLSGGIKRVGAFSAKLVPVMFVLYLGSSLLILAFNVEKLGDVFMQILSSAFSPYAMASGTLVGGIVSALRWGIFKGTQATEAGIGTQTIPHSMSATNDSAVQGMLAMLSTYTAGGLAFLSGCVALVTETWLDPTMPLGMSMVVASYERYFSFFGIVIVAVCALLFATGTILGNAYNGGQCFNYLIKGEKERWYYFFATAIVIVLSAVAEAKLVWSLSDLVLASIALPHMTALLLHAYKKPVLSTSLP